MHPELPTEPASSRRRVIRLSDRLWDAAAVGFVIGGLSLFLSARQSLTSLGDGTYAVPRGVSSVARADLHVAQSRFGMWVIGLGVLVGVAAAVRHRLRDQH